MLKLSILFVVGLAAATLGESRETKVNCAAVTSSTGATTPVKQPASEVKSKATATAQVKGTTKPAAKKPTTLAVRSQVQSASSQVKSPSGQVKPSSSQVKPSSKSTSTTHKSTSTAHKSISTPPTKPTSKAPVKPTSKPPVKPTSNPVKKPTTTTSKKPTTTPPSPPSPPPPPPPTVSLPNATLEVLPPGVTFEGCEDVQTQIILSALTNAKTMARNALQRINTEGATGDVYRRWFGLAGGPSDVEAQLKFVNETFTKIVDLDLREHKFICRHCEGDRKGLAAEASPEQVIFCHKFFYVVGRGATTCGWGWDNQDQASTLIHELIHHFVGEPSYHFIPNWPGKEDLAKSVYASDWSIELAQVNVTAAKSSALAYEFFAKNAWTNTYRQCGERRKYVVQTPVPVDRCCKDAPQGTSLCADEGDRGCRTH